MKARVAVQRSRAMNSIGRSRDRVTAFIGGTILFVSLVSRPSAQVVKLNGPLTREVVGAVASFEVSPDGAQVVYVSDERADEVYELFVSPADGSQPPLVLNAPLVSGGDVLPVAQSVISSDSSRVVFRADQDTNDVSELFSVPIDGSTVPTKLNGPLVPSGDIISFEVSPLADRVVYLADQATDEVLELFSAPIDGSSAPVRLNGALVAGGDVLEFRI